MGDTNRWRLQLCQRHLRLLQRCGRTRQASCRRDRFHLAPRRVGPAQDVALEALRDAWRERKTTMDEIGRVARICRVERVMRAYLEALVA